MEQMQEVKQTKMTINFDLENYIRKSSFETICQSFENGLDVDVTDNFDSTPLVHAIFHGRFDVAHYLINVGANVNIPEEDGETALLILLYKFGHDFHTMPEYPEYMSLLKNLLFHGADTSVRPHYGDKKSAYELCQKSPEIIKLFDQANLVRTMWQLWEIENGAIVKGNFESFLQWLPEEVAEIVNEFVVFQ